MGKTADIKGMLALVTGADGGIGIEFCRALAARGCNLVMLSNRDESLHSAAAAIAREFPSINIDTLTLDLLSEGFENNLKNFLSVNNMEINILVNNAGIFSFNPVLETSRNKIDAFIDLHICAVTALTVSIGDMMVRRRRGWILNMSSMSCWMPMPGIAMYSATKAYIRTFTRAFACEVDADGVKVMAACPGGIATDLFGLPENLKRLALRIGAIDRPDRFASKAVARLLRGRRQYINGFINRLAIVFIASLPTAARKKVKSLLLDKNIRRP